MTLKINIGAMASPLSWQLTKQNFLFNKEEVDHFQKDIDALVRLRVRGILTSNEAEKANKRIFKKIEQHISKMNKPVKQ